MRTSQPTEFQWYLLDVSSQGLRHPHHRWPPPACSKAPISGFSSCQDKYRREFPGSAAVWGLSHLLSRGFQLPAHVRSNHPCSYAEVAQLFGEPPTPREQSPELQSNPAVPGEAGGKGNAGARGKTANVFFGEENKSDK